MICFRIGKAIAAKIMFTGNVFPNPVKCEILILHSNQGVWLAFKAHSFDKCPVCPRCPSLYRLQKHCLRLKIVASVNHQKTLLHFLLCFE